MPPKKNRIIFKIDGNDVTSGGIIFYRYTAKSIDLLLINSERSIEDLGGCTEKGDIDIYYTVAREVEEESNKKFNRKNLIKRLKNDSTKHIYTAKSKYVIFILRATEKEQKFKKEDFGTKETHDNIERQIKWMPLEFFLKTDIIKDRLNWRLRNPALFNVFKEIKNKKFGGNIFSKHLTSISYVNSSDDNESSDTSSDSSLSSTSEEESSSSSDNDSDSSSGSDSSNESSGNKKNNAKKSKKDEDDLTKNIWG